MLFIIFLILMNNSGADYIWLYLLLFIPTPECVSFSVFPSVLISGALQQHVLSESEGLPEGGVLFPLGLGLGADTRVF